MITFIIKIRKQTQKLNKAMLRDIWHEAKWMYQYARKYWRAIVYYIILGVLGTGMGLAGSVASKYLIDAVTGYDSANIGFIITTILCMALGNIVIKAATSRISARISLKVNNEIQAEVYDKILNTDWQSMSEYHSGDLLNRLNGDVRTVADSVLGWIPSLITRLVQFVGTFTVIMYYDSTMAIIALLSAPVTLLMSRMLMGRMRDYNKKVRKVSSDMMAFHEESFQNIQTIKCFDLVHYFGYKLRNLQKKQVDIALDYNRFSIYTSSFMSIVGVIVTYATFGWGVFRLWGGFITYGTMTLFLQLSGNLSSGFSALVGMVPSAIGATTSAGRIMGIVELPRERQEESKTVHIMKQNAKNLALKVQLAHVDFGYKERSIVLQNISFCANPQEIVAIIGSSGEGKTTLIRILLGLFNPTRGEAKLVDGNGMEATISAASRSFFAYVPQGNTIFSGTIADNLRMVRPEATDEELVNALKAACAYEFVEELPDGIHTKIGEKGCGLSEGQAQRISIARAVLRNAPILLLDEATSALDVDTENRVLSGIMAYRKIHTCILTTHRQSVLSMCDRVYQINNAQLIELTEMVVNY